MTGLAVPALATGPCGSTIGPIAPLDPSGLTAGAGFGTSVAVGGKVAVIGAPTAAGGLAYVYARGNGGWRQTAVLRGADTQPGDYFGGAVAVAGATIVVGADDHHKGSGRAYVFTLGRRGWRQTGELSAGRPQPHSGFGFSVAAAGGTIVVGAQSGLGAGAAYVFTDGSRGWHQVARLADAVAGASFGFSVATSGPVVLVGDPGSAAGAGRAYVFGRAHHVWDQTGELVGRHAQAGDNFGYSVAVSAGQALVGAPWQGAGTAYFFGATTQGWRQNGEVTGRDIRLGDNFGDSVALGDGLAVVGAPGPNTGRAYLFRRADRGWRQIAEMSGPPAAGGSFGIAAAASGTSVIVGANGYRRGAGAAWATANVPNSPLLGC